METETNAIQIARVKRQNSSGDDVRWERLYNGKPWDVPSYAILDYWDKRSLKVGESFQTFAYTKFMKLIPVPWPERCSNMDGRFVKTLVRRP